MQLAGRTHKFEIAAMERDQYHILEVTDTFQLIPGGWDSLNESNPTPELIQAPIYADTLAKSLADEWGRSISPVGGMGVRVMPDGMEEGTPEFKNFLNQLSGEVQTLAQWAIRDAMDKHTKGESRTISDRFHRRLAQWLYGEAQARALDWYNASTVEAFKQCVACGETINASARVCKSCGTDLVKFHRDNADLDPSLDPVVAAAFARTEKIAAPSPTKRTASAVEVPAPLRVPVEVPPLVDAVRAACVGVMSAEQKAQMQLRKVQAEKDQFIIGLMSELALKNPNLKTLLIEKGYVLPDAD